MRVAFVSTVAPGPWTGGSEWLWHALAMRCLSEGAAVLACAATSPSEIPQRDAFARLGGVYASLPAGRGNLMQRLTRRLTHPLTQPRLRFADAWSSTLARRLAQFGPDVVLISQNVIPECLPAADVCHRLGMPTIILTQAAGEDFWPADDVLDRLRQVFAAAAQVWFVSRANQRHIETQLGESLSNAAVVHNPVRLPSRPAFQWPDESTAPKTRLACVGRLTPPHKGQDVLLDVWRSAAWDSRSASLTFFGTGGHRDWLLHHIEHAGLGHRTSLGGYVPDVMSIWQQHHALVLPSRVEGMPLAVVEAMLCGRVCIVTPAAGGGELVEDGRIGFVAAFPRADALSDAMERAWAARPAWPAIGAAAAEHARRWLPGDVLAPLMQRLRAAT